MMAQVASASAFKAHGRVSRAHVVLDRYQSVSIQKKAHSAWEWAERLTRYYRQQGFPGAQQLLWQQSAAATTVLVLAIAEAVAKTDVAMRRDI